MIEPYLGRLAAGEDLTQAEMAAAVEAVMLGLCSEGEIGLLLTALAAKGETVAELAGAAQALRQQMVPVRTRRTGLVDTCGTGGDASGTFNISTAAAIVAAAAGVPVAKHGNRSITSRSGSADVLAALGVNVEADVPRVEACLDELGIGFCFAPKLHPAMKHVAAVRRKLGMPTIFNLLGPLANPAGAPFQLLGVGRADVQAKIAAALGLLGTQRALVVRGEDGLDEVSLGAATQVFEVRPQGTRQFTWQPSDFGLSPAGREALLVSGPEKSAGAIRQILAGAAGAPRDVTLLNAAAAIWVAGGAASPIEAAALAAGAIDSGAAARLLERWIELSTA